MRNGDVVSQTMKGDRYQQKRKRSQRRHAWRRQLRYIYVRFIRMRGSSRAIARGLAAGVFAGWFPLFGLQTIMGVAIAIAIQGNKIMAAAGTWVSNPLTYAPIYYFNFRVGEVIVQSLGFELDIPSLDELQDFTQSSTLPQFQEVLSIGVDFTVTLFLGCVVTGMISAVLAYFLGLWAIQTIRQSRAGGSSAEAIAKSPHGN